jgi:phosphoribosylformimino-5-aminoimidazole carboxamide ribotide isomerase
MIIYPAIDLKEGKCVRLFKGDMAQATVFSDSPAAQAKEFAEAGFKWLHIVDLNGAIEGKPVNIEAVKNIIDNTNISIQLGGGIRDLETIESWLEAGVKRVILGTIALTNPELVKEACRKFPNKIAVGIDAKNGKVATNGWVEESDVTAIELAKAFENCGVATIIYTDINRDGAMAGANLEETKALAEQTSIPIIASGGVSSLDDLQDIKALGEFGVAGAIVGRAFYDKAISYPDALRHC